MEASRDHHGVAVRALKTGLKIMGFAVLHDRSEGRGRFLPTNTKGLSSGRGKAKRTFIVAPESGTIRVPVLASGNRTTAHPRVPSSAKAVTGPGIMRRSLPLVRNRLTKNLLPEVRTCRPKPGNSRFPSRSGPIRRFRSDRFRHDDG